MKKKLAFLLSATLIGSILTIPNNVFASTNGEKSPHVSDENYSGGVKVIDPNGAEVYSIQSGNSTKNKVSSNEVNDWSNLKFTYTGKIEFVPAYVIPSNPGYELTPGKQVCQAYFNYTINGDSISGGRVYTSYAPASYIQSTYSVSKTVSDTLIPGQPKTQFWWGWYYF